MLGRLKAQDDSRQEFVSNVSHELKTPLTSMKVLADSLLIQENVPTELYREFMGDLSEEIERENKIINDLLSLVKMDKTASNMNIQSVSMNELVEKILKRLRPLLQNRMWRLCTRVSARLRQKLMKLNCRLRLRIWWKMRSNITGKADGFT